VAHLLGAEGISLSFPTKDVFDDVTVGLDEGDRIGVVGRNGDGKSTLLRLLAGRMQPDSGRVTRRGGVTVGMLDQSDDLPAASTVAELVVDGRAEHEWAGDPRIRDVLTGLLPGIPWDAAVGDLSGGQRRRVALAALLTHDWDIVFLDEPTNHLDIEGVAWLAGHLKKRWPANQGGLVVVTHDRWFLDEVSTATWEVHDAVVEPFEGGYAAYILQRVERDRQAAASEARRQNLLRKELAWLRRGAPARTSKPKFRMDAAAALIANEPPVRDSVSLAQLAVSRLGKDVVDLLDASVSFDGREVVHPVEWRIAPGERTGILGVNGAGKSTLLGLLAGRIAPDSGTVSRRKGLRVALLEQDVRWLDGSVTPRTLYERAVGERRAEAVPLADLGLLADRDLDRPVGRLSIGQQRRVALALIIARPPHVFLLDEPTNHLSLALATELEEALGGYPGAVVVASHDRWLRRRWTDPVLHLAAA
jgi:ATPase subunit of ABC transporter with duplicated ATPase domains